MSRTSGVIGVIIVLLAGVAAVTFTPEIRSRLTGAAPAVCGNGVCETGGGEACLSCPTDCGSMNCCGDGECDGLEVCDRIPGDADPNHCAADCADDNDGSGNGTEPVCGDGTVECGEECDGGPGLVSGWAAFTPTCDDNCTAAVCGDGSINTVRGEECDSAGTDSLSCDAADCTYATCGDSYINATAGESCDDGGNVACDGCSATCKVESCGNGVSECAEECDDGNADACDGCNASCQAELCGDGFLEASCEQCDDGNVLNGDGCSASCMNELCGDGVVQAGEVCDDGNTASGDSCAPNCQAFTGVSCDTGLLGNTYPLLGPEECGEAPYADEVCEAGSVTFCNTYDPERPGL